MGNCTQINDPACANQGLITTSALLPYDIQQNLELSTAAQENGLLCQAVISGSSIIAFSHSFEWEDLQKTINKLFFHPKPEESAHCFMQIVLQEEHMLGGRECQVCPITLRCTFGWNGLSKRGSGGGEGPALPNFALPPLENPGHAYGERYHHFLGNSCI